MKTILENNTENQGNTKCGTSYWKNGFNNCLDGYLQAKI